MVADPITPEEWLEAVELADFYIRLHAAREYGLVDGGPDVDVARCDQILKAGSAIGVRPRRDSVERITRAIVGGRR